MIGHPVNDQRCMGAISEVIRELVDQNDPYIMQIASEHPTTESLAAWIRSLPQRDDLGDPQDGPKVDECSPVQRLRLPAQDPNCVERAALYIAAAEMIDPLPERQLMTIDTAVGLHTFPMEGGEPVLLDPRVTRNCVEGGLALFAAGPIPISPRDAVELTAQFAALGVDQVRNGPSQVKQGKEAMMRLVQDGKAPSTTKEVDAMALLLALAEHVARRYGSRALVLVRSTARAIADLSEEVLHRTTRNLSLKIGGYRLRPTPWAEALARVAVGTGANVGLTALQAKLVSMGVPPSLLEDAELHLRAEGFDLRRLASTPGPRSPEPREEPA